MIVLHRLGHANTPLYVNRDLIVTVEANPDTVITLTTGDKLVVEENPRTIVEKMKRARVDVLTRALRSSGGPSDIQQESPLTTIGPHGIEVA